MIELIPVNLAAALCRRVNIYNINYLSFSDTNESGLEAIPEISNDRQQMWLFPANIKKTHLRLKHLFQFECGHKVQRYVQRTITRKQNPSLQNYH